MATEKTSLLASGTYEVDVFTKAAEVENRVKGYYIKGMKFIRAREFMAEFLATFLLVVRPLYEYFIYVH